MISPGTKVLNQIFIPMKICIIFGNGLGDRYSLRLSLILVILGSSGLFLEIINAFEYVQGARKGLSNLIVGLETGKHFADKPEKRLTLIASDPRISVALMILSVTKMILIYLNYRLWSVKLKVIYGKVLDTLVLDRNRKHIYSNNIFITISKKKY